MNGVAILYRWSVAADHQQKFVRRWRTTALELCRRGATASWLLRADNDDFVALVRWPSEYARERASKTRVFGDLLSGISAFAEARLSVEEEVTSKAPAALGWAL